MVGLPCAPDPVSLAQAAIHMPNATITTALNSLNPPPLHEIPHIDAASPGNWAQCLAMVQDIWDAELFVATSPDHRSGLLVENAAASDSPAATLAERLPIYLVSPPGETAWVRAARTTTSVTAPPIPREKRPRDDDADMPDPNISNAPSAAAQTAAAGPSSADGKRPKPHQSPPTTSPAAALGLNLPVPGQPGATAIIAKLYSDTAAKNLKLNTLVHAVGILQAPLSVTPDPTDAAFADELAARNPRNVARLHVVALRDAAEWELNPATACLVRGVDAARAELRAVLPGMREMVVKYLASALMGDMLAAEYLLLCLVARPAQRTPDGAALGKLSVNVVAPAGAPPNFADELAAALAHVCAGMVKVDLSIAALNAREVFPRKDYALNRLRAAPLQLAGGAVLLGDETALSDGRLAERGVRNVRALADVSARCVVPVDFQYYQTEMPVRCCAVFVSRGGKSIIPADVRVRVKEDGGLGLLPWQEYGEELVGKLRLALALLAEDGPFDIGEEASRAVEEEYVVARRSGRAKDGQETLQSWLAVARCCARSFGESMLTAERWRYASGLEKKRAAREAA